MRDPSGRPMTRDPGPHEVQVPNSIRVGIAPNDNRIVVNLADDLLIGMTPETAARFADDLLDAVATIKAWGRSDA